MKNSILGEFKKIIKNILAHMRNFYYDFFFAELYTCYDTILLIDDSPKSVNFHVADLLLRSD